MAAHALAAADGQWPRLLIELAGLAPEQLQNRHQPCPACGGTDRYRWDQDDGPGGWFCNQCGGKDHSGGGGNGLDLLMRVSGWDFATAVRRVEAHLGLPSAAGQAQPEPLPPPASSRCAEARPAARSASRPARIPEQPPSTAPAPELGRATAQWCYRNGQGQPLFWVQRLDLQRGGRTRKLFVQRTWLDGGWHFPSRRDPFRSDWPAPRPLYRLPELERHPWSEVLITEGEKAADAAALLFPELVVVSWCGGSQALQTVDWAPLAQRPVILWPDADAAGREAMAKLSALLLELHCTVTVVLPPSCTAEDWDLADAPGADGWDLADADWTREQAMAHLGRHRRQVQRPAHPPDLQAQDQAPDHAENASSAPPASPAAAADPPAGPRTADRPPGPTPPAAAGVAAAVNAEPFQCLGYDSDGYYYQPQATGQVVRLGSSAHGGVNLCRLAPLAYWETLYPCKRGVNWTAAASDLFCRQAAVGMFDPDGLRGRGVWWDQGRCVLHLGDRLVVDGTTKPVTALPGSRFHYQRGTALKGPADAIPLSDEEALTVLTIADRFWWDVPASAFLLAGWVTLAPICGALNWRPHLWLSAAAGSGKSQIFERFIALLLGDIARVFVGSVTEAGIRQTLRSDALPVLIDEAESNEKADQQRIQGILSLARVASSESRAAIVKGSASGEVSRYSVRSMFLLSSIATGLKQGADRRRFAQLTLRNPADIPQQQRQAHWDALAKDLEELITPTFATRLIARTVSLIPVIRRSIVVCCRVAAVHFDSQALGDQYGTLLAGAWALQSSTVPSDADVQALIEATDWSSYRESTEIPDERRCLNRILQHQLRVETEDRVLTRSIGELVELIQSVNPLEPVSSRHAEELLSRHGLRIAEGMLLVSNTAEAIGRILAETAWASSWSTILGRLPGAGPHGHPVRFRGAGSKARACAIPLGIL
jgi:putative DNA primase/helicase